MGEVALGFSVPIAAVALAVGPSQLLYWAVLGNGSYLGVNSGSILVIGMFVLMTLGFAACNLPLLWKLPSAWHDRREPALDGERDTDLWIWLIAAALSVGIGLRFFGHYYMQLVPPLALLAAGALARSGRRAVTATIVAASVLAAGVLGRRLLHAPLRARTDVRVGQCVRRGQHPPRRQDPRVG